MLLTLVVFGVGILRSFFTPEIAEIARHGIFSTPAVIVDRNAGCVGKVPSKVDAKGWLGHYVEYVP